MPSDPARNANDGPARAEAGPAVTERRAAAGAEIPEQDHQDFDAGTALAGAALARTPAGPAPARPAMSSAGVLADRLAAALVHHEPGWRLPRHSALARRYNVSTAEIDAAVGELAARHLVRCLPDGQVYRASPAEYLVPLAGVPGLASHIDPMGGQIACRSRQVSWRRVAEDIGWALGVPPGEPACVIRLLWTVDGEPAAVATTYLARHLASRAGDQDAAAPTVLPPALDAAEPGHVPAGLPHALHIEMQPPPPSVARSLRLSPGQPAALTAAVLRSDLFRIVVQSGDGPLTGEGAFAGIWARAAEDWEP